METNATDHKGKTEQPVGKSNGRCRRGDIFYANLNPVIGSEQGGLRPVLILQNDRGNRFSRTTIVAAITSRTGKARLPTHLELSAERYRLDRDSVALLEQIRTIDKRRLKNRIGGLDDHGLRQLEQALCASLGIRANEPDAATAAQANRRSKS